MHKATTGLCQSLATVLLLTAVVLVSTTSACVTAGRHSRSVSSSGGLWPNRTVYYAIDTMSPELNDTIHLALDEWKSKTCLEFQLDRAPTGYVLFTTDNFCAGDIGDCCSDEVGHTGEKQVISLPESKCRNTGVIMHLIGHVIGFWHEESRPDRDQYVSFVRDNLRRGAQDQFQKRNDLNVDYQGVGYDYGSIMHSSLTAFSKCRTGCPTMEVNDQAIYKLQGSPAVGQMDQITEYDVTQANRLYSCPGDGVPGRLTIYVYNGTNFPNLLNSYVQVTAVDNRGNEVLTTTDVRANTADPSWEQDLEIGEGEWQFLRLRVYSRNGGKDMPISMSETVAIHGSVSLEKHHCFNTICRAFVKYLYEFVVDGNECSPNPCQNGGKCTDLFADFRCTCSKGWTGRNCQIRRACSNNPCQNGGTCTENTDIDAGISTYTCDCRPGWTGTDCDIVLPCYSNPCQNGGTCSEDIDHEAGISTYSCQCPDEWDPDTNCQSQKLWRLKFYARYGRGLPGRNPYIEVTAYYHGGYSETRTTNTSHSWDEVLDFGTRAWRNFRLRVLDYNYMIGNSDTPLSSYLEEDVGPGSHQWRKFHCNTGFIRYDYYLHHQSYVHNTVHSNEEDSCHPNPCQNGGACVEGQGEYTCYCPPGWGGENCRDRFPCYDNPCQHGGMCSSTTGQCSCPNGWVGTKCQFRCYCQHGGTCIPTGWFLYWCSCPDNWGGFYCDIRKSTLTFKIISGSNLRNRDHSQGGVSDPYVTITARNHNSQTETKRTRIIYNSLWPTWGQTLTFDANTWTSHSMQVFDWDDHDDDERLSSFTTYAITPLEHYGRVHHCFEGGRIIYDYHF